MLKDNHRRAASRQHGTGRVAVGFPVGTGQRRRQCLLHAAGDECARGLLGHASGRQPANGIRVGGLVPDRDHTGADRAGACRRSRRPDGTGASGAILEDLRGSGGGPSGAGDPQVASHSSAAACCEGRQSLRARGGKMGAVLGGLFLGGGVAAFSLCCNPGIFIVLGASVLLGRVVWGMVLMAAFAVGFSLPLGRHSLRCVIWQGVHQGAEGGRGDPSRRRSPAGRRGPVFVGVILTEVCS